MNKPTLTIFLIHAFLVAGCFERSLRPDINPSAPINPIETSHQLGKVDADIENYNIAFGNQGQGYILMGRTKNHLPLIDYNVIVTQNGRYQYDHVFAADISQDGMHSAWAVERNGKSMIVIDGVEQAHHDQVWDPAFSSNSRNLAYIFREGSDSRISLNGIESSTYEEVRGDAMIHLDHFSQTHLSSPAQDESTPMFSLDSSRIGYKVSKGHKTCLGINGSSTCASPEWASFLRGPIFSNSNNAGYIVKLFGSGYVVMKNDRLIAGPYSNDIYGMSFMNDGETVVYVVRDNLVNEINIETRDFLFVDGEKIAEHSFIGPWPTVGHKSKSIAFIASDSGRRGNSFVVVNGRHGASFDRVDDPVFSPDDTKVSYLAAKAGKLYLVVTDSGGEAIYETDASDANDYIWSYHPWPKFSPSGRLCAFTYYFKDATGRTYWKVSIAGKLYSLSGPPYSLSFNLAETKILYGSVDENQNIEWNAIDL